MIVAILVGGALALAGLLMQSITRNPLASPQIFGVNAGASFIIVLVTVLMPTMGNYATYLAFIGAFIGGLTVYLLSGSTKNNTSEISFSRNGSTFVLVVLHKVLFYLMKILILLLCFG